MVRKIRCNRCGKCLDVCASEAISLHEDGVQIDRAKCELCMKCVDIYPAGAIESAGKYMSVKEVV